MFFSKMAQTTGARIRSWGRAFWRAYDAHRTRRIRVFVWSCAILFAFFAVCDDAYQPAELLIQAARNELRMHDSDGGIVVVGLDDRTNDELGGTNFPRRYLAQGVDRLFKLGAKRVYFDRFYNEASNPADDHAFADTLLKYRGRVFLGIYAPPQRAGHHQPVYVPTPVLKNSSLQISLAAVTIAGISQNLPYALPFNGKNLTSMSASLARFDKNPAEIYRPDYSIRASSIPTVSYVDVLRGRIVPKLIAGKDVVIGPTATQFHDVHLILEQGYLSGVYVHVIGAETLKGGIPVEWGRWPGLLLAALLGAANLWARQRFFRRIALCGAIASLGVVPTILDHFHVTADVFPGLFLFGVIAVRATYLRNKEAAFDVNELTGLANVNALYKGAQYRKHTLIALKISNLAAIVSSFDERVEQIIFAEVNRRIGVTKRNDFIYHGDDTLYWFTEQRMDEQLAEHLEGLRAILDKMIIVGTRTVDLNVAFGVDADLDRLVSSRIGSAALSAEEAARQNLIWKFYDPERRHAVAEQLTLMSALDRAIEEGELFVEYQPKVELATSQVIGAEALVRWMHPLHGRVGPDTFIALAEKNHRIERLTYFVLDEALKATVSARHIQPEFNMAVNISTQLLLNNALLVQIDRLLAHHHLPPEALTLEITETAELDRSGTAFATVDALRQRGMRISVDDYGTGHATLDYLRTLFSDEVKLDRSFVANIDHNERDMGLVGDTITTVHNLGRKVVAEGVETISVLRALMRLGCDSAQGYLLGRPMDLPALLKVLTTEDGKRRRKCV